ncbi:MAG TPA: putative quinol monooxygenase [Fimbriiglobus sp.]
MLSCFLAFASVVGLAAPVADDNPVVVSVKAKLKDADKPFVLVVKLKIKAGMNEKFTALFAEAIKGTRKEVGNLSYDLNRDADDGQTYVAYEKWKNLKALEDHMKADYVVKLLAGLTDLAEGMPDVKIYTPSGE